MPLPLANPQTERSARVTIVEAPALLRRWHLASLDAPTVAVVWSLSFAWAAGIHLPAWVPCLLALGTWCVYLCDRMLDARSALRTGDVNRLRERHFFHWRHRRVLVPFAVASAAIGLMIIVVCMPVAIRERNSVLAVAALAYFSGVHLPRRQQHWFSLFLSKEFLVGMLFGIGCAVPTLTRMPIQNVTACPIFAALIAFASLAWLNCHAIEQWESGHANAIRPIARLLAIASIALAAACAPINLRSTALLLACSVSALLLAILDRQRNRLSPMAQRIAADLVLLTPLALLVR